MIPTDRFDSIVRLPMYDWPETGRANDALWARWRHALAERGMAGLPEALDREQREETATADLLIGQTCGVTYARHLADETRLIATPRYRAEGCEGPHYCSMVVVRRDSRFSSFASLAGTTAAVNDRGSYSGWVALVRHAGSDEDYFGGCVTTGSHRASAAAVATGMADCAAIDAVCWALLGRHAPEIRAALRVVDRTSRVPGLPLLAGPACGGDELEIVRAGLDETLADPAMATVLDDLLIAGVARLEPEDYSRLA